MQDLELDGYGPEQVRREKAVAAKLRSAMMKMRMTIDESLFASTEATSPTPPAPPLDLSIGLPETPPETPPGQ